MATLLMLKEKLKEIYAEYYKIIVPTAKAIVAFMMLLAINDKIGFMARLDSFAVVLALTVVCAFLPTAIMVLAGLAVVLLHFSALRLYLQICPADVFLPAVRICAYTLCPFLTKIKSKRRLHQTVFFQLLIPYASKAW